MTKSEFKYFTESVETRFQGIDVKFKEVDRRFDDIDRKFTEIDRRFDDLTKLIIDIGEHLTKKIESLADRLDRTISQNALDHNKFDARLAPLEERLANI